MRYLFFACIIACFIACKGTSPQSLSKDKYAYTLPVKLGDNWSKIGPQLGAPDKSSGNFASYFSKGFIVYFNPASKEVNTIVCSYFMGANSFKGKVFGVSLGDTYPKCVSLWGEPIENGAEKEDYYERIWQFKKSKLALEFWRNDGQDLDIGDYKAETVKRIKIGQ